MCVCVCERERERDRERQRQRQRQREGTSREKNLTSYMIKERRKTERQRERERERERERVKKACFLQLVPSGLALAKTSLKSFFLMMGMERMNFLACQTHDKQELTACTEQTRHNNNCSYKT